MFGSAAARGLQRVVPGERSSAGMPTRRRRALHELALKASPVQSEGARCLGNVASVVMQYALNVFPLNPVDGHWCRTHVSGIDLALHVVERYYGRIVAERTAFWLEYQGQGWKDGSSNLAYAARPKLTGAHPRCPVCEMEFGDADLKIAPSEIYKGKTYYFCSTDDKARFDRSPERYAEE